MKNKKTAKAINLPELTEEQRKLISGSIGEIVVGNPSTIGTSITVNQGPEVGTLGFGGVIICN